MEYTTLATLKEYLGVTGTTLDTTLTKVITRCTKQFDKYLGRNLEEKTYTEYFIMDSEDIAIVANGPLTAITKLKIDDENGADVPFSRIDGNIIYLKESLEATLFVEYTGWYADLDEVADVEQACLEVCKDIWDNTPASGNESNIKSKQIETLSKTYFSKDEMAGGIGVSFRETLDNYKSFNPLII